MSHSGWLVDGRVWYIARDGARMPGTVVSIDISHPPPFYGIRMPGSEGVRETEGHRLAAMSPADVARHGAPDLSTSAGKLMP